MTPERTKELLPVMEHFANGGVVQTSSQIVPNPGWIDDYNPLWSVSQNYRKKPKPREIYLNFIGASIPLHYSTKGEALEDTYPGITERAVKFVEVLDETD